MNFLKGTSNKHRAYIRHVILYIEQYNAIGAHILKEKLGQIINHRFLQTWPNSSSTNHYFENVGLSTV